MSNNCEGSKNLDIKILKTFAKQIRKDIITEVSSAGSGHPGGSLSSADIMTVLYFNEMNINPENPYWEDRDRFVLSKGHGSPVLYAALARRGYFNPELLKTFRQLGSPLQGHPHLGTLDGVDASTGSLGQGISQAVGIALAGKMDKKDYRVYTLLGDGECEEGMVWEAAMAAAHYKLDNLCVIVDANHLQIDGRVEDVMNVYPICAKFSAFGFNVIRIDGHDMNQILDAFEAARNCKDKPSCILASTVKGKGVSFMENNPDWHGKAPNAEQTETALSDIDNDYKGIDSTHLGREC